VNGSASCAVASLALGVHALGASYSGDANHLASVAVPVSHTVLSASVTLLSTECTLTVVDNTPFTVTATISGAAPTGSVTFYRDGTAPFCADTALAQQSAACATTLHTVAGHAQDGYALTAAYSGDSANAASVSAPLAVRVLAASEIVFRDGFQTAVSGCALR
ncbi:MAG: Ig-like domain-containing protein, partial [Tahibacter sp.]